MMDRDQAWNHIRRGGWRFESYSNDGFKELVSEGLIREFPTRKDEPWRWELTNNGWRTLMAEWAAKQAVHG